MKACVYIYGLCIIAVVNMCTAYPGCVGNVAFNKPTFQSSTKATHHSGLAKASRAVDGNMNTKFYGCNSCTHTVYGNNPWWVVDLEEEHSVHSVEITSRLDGEKLQSIEISVGEKFSETAGVLNKKFCAKINSTSPQPAGTTRKYPCSGTLRGRFIMITMKKTGSLVLCEVKVFTSASDTAGKLEMENCQTHFSKQRVNEIVSSEPILHEIMKSKGECAMKCTTVHTCLAFSTTVVADVHIDCRLFDCLIESYITHDNTSFYLPSGYTINYQSWPEN